MRVLIVEDDPVLRDGIKVGLSLAGIGAETAASCKDADSALLAGQFSAIVLDIMLPDGSGLDLLSLMR